MESTESNCVLDDALELERVAVCAVVTIQVARSVSLLAMLTLSLPIGWTLLCIR